MFESLTSRLDKLAIIIASAVLLGSLYFVYSLHLSYTQREAIHDLDNALLLTRNMLDEEERHAMSLSLLLSQNKALLKAYQENDRKAVFDMVNDKIKSLKAMQGYDFEVQVHDKQIKTYLRNWDFSITGVPLATFREGLVLVKKYKKPLVSIEVGKRLNIKAISPILRKGEFVGSIEVIEGFGHLREKLLEHGYALLILLDRKYLDIATTLQAQPVVAHRYVLVNHIYDQDVFNSLKTADVSSLGSYGYFSHDGYLFGYFELKNYDDERLGYCVIALEEAVPTQVRALHKSGVVDRKPRAVIIQ